MAARLRSSAGGAARRAAVLGGQRRRQGGADDAAKEKFKETVVKAVNPRVRETTSFARPEEVMEARKHRMTADGGMVDGAGIKRPDPARAFKKGSFDLEKGGFSAFMTDRADLLEVVKGSQPEPIDFSEYHQDVLGEFRGATEMDWEEMYEMIIQHDFLERLSIFDWRDREPGLVKYRCALTSMLLILHDVYFVNPISRHQVVPQTVASSTRLEEKTLKAGWWQEAFRKVFVRNLCEDVPVLKAITASLNAMKGQSRFYARNIVNTYCNACTKRINGKTNADMVRFLDQTYGALLLMVMDCLLKVDLKANPEVIEASAHLGRAWGGMYVIRSLYEARRTNSVLIPQALLDVSGLTLQQLHERTAPKQNSRNLVFTLVTFMKNELELAKSKSAKLPRHIRRMGFYRWANDVEAFVATLHEMDYDIPITADDMNYLNGRYDARRGFIHIKKSLLWRTM